MSLTTGFYIGFLLLLIFLTFIISALFLRLALQFLKVENVTYRKVGGVLLAIALVNVTTTSLAQISALKSPEYAYIQWVLLLFALACDLALITYIFQISVFRAIATSVITLVPVALINWSLATGTRNFVFETYFMPTNAMAPTLIGNHYRGVCPECGSPSYCSAYKLEHGLPDLGPANMICEKFHIHSTTPKSEQTHSGVRFAVAKFLKPQRWDVIAFWKPQHPDLQHRLRDGRGMDHSRQVYTFRIVGLPGESVYVDDGDIWVNGERLNKPKAIEGIKYETKSESSQKINGTMELPAVLGPDEYYVLGDFTTNCFDSRWWEFGESGHAHYAVPFANVIGVVTNVYWPPQRWKQLR